MKISGLEKTLELKTGKYLEDGHWQDDCSAKEGICRTKKSRRNRREGKMESAEDLESS